MKATFSLVNGFNCFFYRRQRMDIVVHVKMVFDSRNCFWKFNCIIFCAMVQHENCTKGEQVAPKINLVKWYWLIISSLGQRKRSADWFSCLIAICTNMPSISDRMATGFSRNLKRIPTKLLCKSGPVMKFEFKDWPLNLAAAFATLRNFPRLFGLNTG